MSSIKQLIINAIIKVSQENPALNREGEPTHEEARDAFIAALMAELFPEDTPSTNASTSTQTKETETPVAITIPTAEVTHPVITIPPVPSTILDSPTTPVKTKEPEVPPAPVKLNPKEAEKKAKAEAKEAEKKAKAEAKEAEKKAAAEAKAQAKEAEKKAAAEAKEAEKKAKAEAKETEKKATPPAPVAQPNLPKLDPTWRKALKDADKKDAKTLEPALLTFVNELSNVAFHAKGVKEHITDFLASRKEPEESAESVDFEIVDFAGKEYYVNPETKRVYEGEMGEDGTLKITKPVGYVGMAEFKDMTI